MTTPFPVVLRCFCSGPPTMPADGLCERSRPTTCRNDTVWVARRHDKGAKKRRRPFPACALMVRHECLTYRCTLCSELPAPRRSFLRPKRGLSYHLSLITFHFSLCTSHPATKRRDTENVLIIPPKNGGTQKTCISSRHRTAGHRRRASHVSLITLHHSITPSSTTSFLLLTFLPAPALHIISGASSSGSAADGPG
jgi:hypothetical protein